MHSLKWDHCCLYKARERAWRIGQTRDVTVYRLITRGTIEEKVYQRQIYKHFLTNKILKNPQQKRFFKARDMKDLFVLNDDGEDASTETSNIFSQLSEEVNVVGTHKDDQDKQKSLIPVSSLACSAVDKGSSPAIGSSRNGEDEKDDQNDEMDKETDILRSLFDAHGLHVSFLIVFVPN